MRNKAGLSVNKRGFYSMSPRSVLGGFLCVCACTYIYMCMHKRTKICSRSEGQSCLVGGMDIAVYLQNSAFFKPLRNNIALIP